MGGMTSIMASRRQQGSRLLSRHKVRETLAENGVWIALAALVLFNIFATRGFLSGTTLQTNLSQMASIMIAAIGMTLIIATGGIDLSVGSIMALSGATAGLLLLSNSPMFSSGVLGVVLIVGVSLVVATLFGLLNGLLVGYFKIQAIVATLVLMIAGRGLAQLVTNGRLFAFDNPELLWLGRGQVLGISAQSWIMIILTALAIWVCRATVFGRKVFAIGGNPRAAKLAGLRVPALTYAVYAIGGLTFGIAGLLNASVNGTVDTANLGLGYEFAVISAVIVGGTSLTGGKPRMVGTLGGAALIQLLTFTLASHNVPREFSTIAQALVIIVAVLAQRLRRV